MTENEMTTIWISKKTKQRFDALGHFRESSDELLNRILDIFEIKEIQKIIDEKMKK